MEQKDKVKDEEKEKQKQENVKLLREKLATRYGCSNYFFYLKSNIDTRTTRGL